MTLNFTHKQKINLDAMSVAAHQLNKQGYIISRPINDAEYDLIIEENSKLSRVYVRTSWGSKNYGPITVDLRKHSKNYDYLYVCGDICDYLIPSTQTVDKSTITLGKKYDIYKLSNLTIFEEINFLENRFKELTGRTWNSHLDINSNRNNDIENTHERLLELYEQTSLFKNEIILTLKTNSLNEGVIVKSDIMPKIGYIADDLSGTYYVYYYDYTGADFNEVFSLDSLDTLFKGRFNTIEDVKKFVFKNRNETIPERFLQ